MFDLFKFPKFDKPEWKVTMGAETVEHRYDLGQELEYKSRPTACDEIKSYVVLQQVTRRSTLGAGKSYQCRECINGSPTGKRVEVDECELKEIGR